MMKILVGPLINDIIEKMVHNHKNVLNPKHEVFLIAGHDMTVLNVMRALGFDDTSKPDIGATVILELHAGPPGLGESSDFVKVIPKNNLAVITSVH